MPSPISVIVADDHALFRQGLVELLRMSGEFDVLAEAESATDVITLVTEHHPDVAILDVGMPGPSTRETLRILNSASPSTRAVIVTMFDDPALISELIRAGAAAYLLKSCDRLELTTAVRVAARADESVLISVSRQAVVGMARAVGGPADLLSARESEVLQLLAEAKSNRDISVLLHISDATVKRHLSNIYAKLDARSRADALRTARKLGLVVD
jgi:DNA-binding NarL/FixJ family response regulator